jgi:hypothetical protein
MEKILLIDHEGLLNLSMRLLLNLSHDEAFRLSAMRMGLLKGVVNLMSGSLMNPDLLMISQQVLYMLSVDKKSKPMFAYTDCVTLVLKLVLESKGDRVGTDLAALGINLTADEQNAQVIFKNNGIRFLMKRAIKTGDSLVFKMLRNISMHPGEIKMPFLVYAFS